MSGGSGGSGMSGGSGGSGMSGGSGPSGPTEGSAYDLTLSANISTNELYTSWTSDVGADSYDVLYFYSPDDTSYTLYTSNNTSSTYDQISIFSGWWNFQVVSYFPSNTYTSSNSSNLYYESGTPA